jgi:hypothetical protein
VWCCQRFEAIGLSASDLRTVLRYIKDEAPIIVHVQLEDTLHFLVKDTHYRNQFETNTSKGGLGHAMVIGWEDRMYALPACVCCVRAVELPADCCCCRAAVV